MDLPLRRFLNWLYHSWASMLTAENRALLDAELSREDTLLAQAREERLRARIGRRIKGLAPSHIPAPSWWLGDRAAFRSGVAAGQQLGEPAARREPPQQPLVGTGR